MKPFRVFAFNFLLIAFCGTTIFAQSGRKDTPPSPTPGVNVSEKDAAKTDSSKQNLEPVEFLISGSLNNFVGELNELGKVGYRVSKAFNYGGDAANSQNFAAVLKLENGNTYEYDF